MRFKSGIIAYLVLVLAFAGVCQAAEVESRDIKDKVEKESREMRAAALKTKELVKKDRARLKEILQGLKADLDKERSSLKRSREEFNELSEQKAALEKEIEEEKDAVKDVQGNVFTAAKNAHSLVKDSPVSSEYRDRFEKLDPLLEKEHFPGMQGIKDLVGILRTEMQESGNIDKYKGKIIAPEGKGLEADIVRVGAMNSVYRDSQGKVGFLQMNSQGEMVAVPADLSWFQQNDIEDYIQGESGHLPMDLSGGAVFKRLSQSRGVADWIEAGGILIWPIFLVALVALLITIERLLFLMRIRSNSDRIMQDINSYIENQDWEECRNYCEKNSRFPTCRVLGSVMEHMGQTREVMENAIQEAILRQVPRLERFLPTLNILGAIAPLLGLLGTVTGMINTFQIITLFGTGDPKLMSGGISEALVTTQLGLAIAIPIMLMHHFLERRVDKIVGDIEEKGNSFTLSLIKHGIVKGEEK